MQRMSRPGSVHGQNGHAAHPQLASAAPAPAAVGLGSSSASAAAAAAALAAMSPGGAPGGTVRGGMAFAPSSNASFADGTAGEGAGAGA